MDLKAFDNFQEGASSAGVILFYSGPFDSETLNEITNNLKGKLQQENASGPVKRKLFSSFIEMTQNILHYGGMPSENREDVCNAPGVIGIGQKDASYWISCGNLVPIDRIDRISEKLIALKHMSIAEIKAAYREQLANDEHQATDAISKGAGLGLLTIARDSTRPIEFYFAPHAESGGRFAYFYIKTVI